LSEILGSISKRFSASSASSRKILIIGVFLVSFVISLNAFANLFGYDPLAITTDVLLQPSLKHLMGTDQLGRDVFIRVCYGAKSSLTVAFIAVVISLSIGTTIGAFSGFFAGKTDRILSIVFDALYAFPGIILAILIAVILGPGIFTTSVAISVGEIPQYFRVVRGLSLSLRERPYMEAEIALGARPRNLIFQHILPYAVPSIVTIMTLSMGSAILQVSGLGFLGLGLPPPTPEWGLDLGRGRDFITMGVWWASTFPGLMILVSVIGFTLIGEALSEILGTKKSVKMA
jgi:peptide/nickel transport system permease protein